MNVEKFSSLNHLILNGDCREELKKLPDGLVQAVITSPPYFGLRAYGTNPKEWGGDVNCEHHFVELQPRRSRSEKDVKNPATIQNANKGANCNLHPTKMCDKCSMWIGELGQEQTPEMFVTHLADIFDEVRRVLRDDGVVWVNLADTYWKEDKVKHTRLKSKDLCFVPQLFAIEMQQRGWYVRSEIIWAKSNCMPESMPDRCTRSHEQIWMFSKKEHYYYDKYGFTTPPKEEALREIIEGSDAGANLRTVWRMNASEGYHDKEGQHHATFPQELPERCLKLSTSEKGACATCGKPYERIVDKQYPQVNAPSEAEETDWYEDDWSPFKGHSGYLKADGTSMIPVVLTTGWQQTCKCDTHGVRPCIVMDIFSGSGTTGFVSFKNNRSYIGLELNETYAKMSDERISGKNLPLLALFDE